VTYTLHKKHFVINRCGIIHFQYDKVKNLSLLENLLILANILFLGSFPKIMEYKVKILT